MTWVIVGLGNPDDEYIHTRHNAGRMAVEYFAKQHKLDEWKDDKKSRSFLLRGTLGRALVACVLPNTYMNKSGTAVAHFVKSIKAAEKLVVVYDELALPLGSIKISFDRGSGGHRGIDSILKAIKTRAFVRIRIGISPTNAAGETKKPQGEKDVEKFILGEFKSTELAALKAALKRTNEALETIITDGREKAMNSFN
ncbi:MAG: aminoacyl-tRNA hydrolase [Minisyncoccia bacterium]